MADWTITYQDPAHPLLGLFMQLAKGVPAPFPLNPLGEVGVTCLPQGETSPTYQLIVTQFGGGAGANEITFLPAYDSGGHQIPLPPGAHNITLEYTMGPTWVWPNASIGEYLTLEIEATADRRSPEYIPWVKKRMETISRNRRTR